ncbi:hypothetical protein RMN57_07430 [Kitasatospora sp. CM 4170]|uniref:Secreted protein n=1 Tax=Kitasatospora aburaviensis TaxID=67265 RepID=A0ABW1FA05_9ACTN|nr:hypothetical protein [Kitasatospora sp. CM 4170]WNM44554.1 hypothetical protein RMN57_07430 [Kitasatospora sp. CM 4170]
MRTALRTAVTVLTAALASTLLAGAALNGTAAPASAQPREVNQGHSIPVGGITDLGALPVLATLGLDFARLLGR